MDMYMYLTLPTRPRTYWSMALFFSALLTPVLNCIPNTFGCCLNHLILLNIKLNKLKEWLKKRNFIYHSWHMKFSLSNTTSKILHTITCNPPPPLITVNYNLPVIGLVACQSSTMDPGLLSSPNANYLINDHTF